MPRLKKPLRGAKRYVQGHCMYREVLPIHPTIHQAALLLGGGGSLLEASHPPLIFWHSPPRYGYFKNIVQNDVKPRSCRLNAQRGKSRRVLLRGNLHRASDTDYTALTCWSDCRSMDFFIALLARESEREFRGVVENSDPKGHCRLETCAVER